MLSMTQLMKRNSDNITAVCATLLETLLGHMQTTKMQISLHFQDHTTSSAPLLLKLHRKYIASEFVAVYTQHYQNPKTGFCETGLIQNIS